VLHLDHGDVTIVAHGAAADAPYVQSLALNGKAWQKPWVRYADIAGGATLTYELSPVANTHWGTRPADAPPSF
jgi:putative alpha-1,2-mannosidase